MSIGRVRDQRIVVLTVGESLVSYHKHICGVLCVASSEKLQMTEFSKRQKHLFHKSNIHISQLLKLIRRKDKKDFLIDKPHPFCLKETFPQSKKKNLGLIIGLESIQITVGISYLGNLIHMIR